MTLICSHTRTTTQQTDNFNVNSDTHVTFVTTDDKKSGNIVINTVHIYYRLMHNTAFTRVSDVIKLHQYQLFS